MGLPLRKADQHYTYRDYRQWPDDERWELIEGVAYAMGVPTLNHQGISGNLFAEIYFHLKGKPCTVYAAPGSSPTSWWSPTAAWQAWPNARVGAKCGLCKRTVSAPLTKTMATCWCAPNICR